MLIRGRCFADVRKSRNFVSDTSIVADRYEVHADEGVADEAKRVPSTMPGRF